MTTLADHVTAAVEEILSELPAEEANGSRAPLAAYVLSKFWPHVEAAVSSHIAARDLPPVPTSGDRRFRPWQYTARFWRDGELIGEMDPTFISGTGGLPGIIVALAQELHAGATLGPSLSIEALKEKLPQLRNNLGRADTASMRINYELPDAGVPGEFTCQVDVYRLA